MTDFEIVFGTQKTFPGQIVNEDSSLPVLGDFLSMDVLTATVWAGQNQVTIFAPTVIWAVPTGFQTGLTTISITAAQSSMLTPNEQYQLQVFAQRGTGDPVCVGWVQLTVLPAAGSSPVVTPFPSPIGTYATYMDLEFYGPWLDEVQDVMTDQAGFANYLFRARTWLDRIIVSRARPLAYIYNIFTPLTPWGPVEAPNFIIQGYLAANYLLVRDVTIEIVARRALYQIAEKMISYQPNDVWPRRSRYMKASANNLLASYAPEISISSAPSVRIEDPTGGGALALATINPTLGTVTGIIPQQFGVNYTSPTVFLFSHGPGSGATATATPGPGGGLTSYTITNPGSGYFQKQNPDICFNLGMVSMR
jgi:hypothetical protein